MSLINTIKTFTILAITAILVCGSCYAQSSKIEPSDRSLAGLYSVKGSTKKLQLLETGDYKLLWAPRANSHLVLVRCDYFSKGKWKKLANNVIELTSENYFTKEAGFEYKLIKEKKGSMDSMYVKINLPEEFLYYRTDMLNFKFYIDTDVSRSLTTDKTSFQFAKKEHFSKYQQTDNNHFDFYIDAKVGGTTLYKSRVMFPIFSEDIDTKEFNSLTIDLPNFDICFFEFQPLYHELIMIKKPNELVWKGESWMKATTVDRK